MLLPQEGDLRISCFDDEKLYSAVKLWISGHSVVTITPAKIESYLMPCTPKLFILMSLRPGFLKWHKTHNLNYISSLSVGDNKVCKLSHFGIDSVTVHVEIFKTTMKKSLSTCMAEIFCPTITAAHRLNVIKSRFGWCLVFSTHSVSIFRSIPINPEKVNFSLRSYCP